MADSEPPPEKTTLVGSCDGVHFVPAHEYEDYLKGFRQMSYWAAIVLSPVALLVLLIYLW